jgi:hypothetical protein
MKNKLLERTYIIQYINYNTMRTTYVYINKVPEPYISGPAIPKDGIIRVFGKYAGSSTLIGKSGTVYNTVFTAVRFPEIHLKVEEKDETSGEITTIYDGTLKVEEFCKKLIDETITLSYRTEYLEKLEAGTFCPLGELVYLKLPDKQNVSVCFRELHRLDGSVEISGVMYTSSE